MSRSIHLLLSSSIVVGGIFLSTPTFATGNSSQETPRQPQASTQTAPSIRWMNLNAVGIAPLESNIYVRATVVSIAEPRPDSRQPYSIYLMDDSGTMRAVVFQDTWARIPNTDFLRPGTQVDIFGKVDEYRGQRQLTIAQPNHVRRTPGSADMGFMVSSNGGEYTPISVGAISLLTVGQAVVVSGVVSKYEVPDADRIPFKVEVRDPTGAIEVVYWKDLDARIPTANKPVPGQEIHIGGVVSEFRGGLQLRVDDPAMVSRRPFTPITASTEEDKEGKAKKTEN